VSGVVDSDGAVPAALGNQPQGGNSFDGLLDDVFVYDTALTVGELELLRTLDAGLPTLVFSDGFESGDTDAWSNVVP
jgi:hypothetical protein